MTRATRSGGQSADWHEASASAQETMAFLLRLRARGIADINVLRALETIPRLAFVAHRHSDLALRDMALPIGCGQTIHEPFLVARMLEALRVGANHRVLEIGSGSGYTSALLGRLAHDVVGYERFRTLAREAEIRLEKLGAGNVAVIWGDGFEELGGAGLFDRILVDAAIDPERAQSLLGQLAESGIALIGVREEGRSGWARISHCDGAFQREFVIEAATDLVLAGRAHAL